MLALLAAVPLQEGSLPLDLRSLIPPAARQVREMLPESKNAFFDLLVLQKRIRYRAPSSDPRKVISETASEAAEMDRALSRGGFQWPKADISLWLPLPGSDQPGPPTLALSSLRRVRLERTEAFSKLGQVDRAIGEIEAISGLLRKAGAGYPLAIQYMLVSASEGDVTESVVALTRSHRLSRAQTGRLRRALGPAQTVDPDLARMYRVELNEFTLEEYQRAPLRALLQLDPLLMFTGIDPESGGIKVEDVWPVDDPDLLDRRYTFARLAQATARVLPEAAKPWPWRARKASVPPVTMAPDRPWEAGMRDPKPEELAAFKRAAERVPNAFGLFKLSEPPLFDMGQVALRRLTDRSLALAALAIEDGSPALPVDPASLRPLRFDPKKRRVYSVGANERDEKGNGDDRSVRI